MTLSSLEVPIERTQATKPTGAASKDHLSNMETPVLGLINLINYKT